MHEYTGRTWLGIANINGDYVAIDGSPLEYTNWDTTGGNKQPNNSTGDEYHFSLKANNKMWNICCTRSQTANTVCVYTVPGLSIPYSIMNNDEIYNSEFCITATSSQTVDTSSGTCGTAYRGGAINVTKIASDSPESWFGETISTIPASFTNYIHCMPHDSVGTNDQFMLISTNNDGVSVNHAILT